MCTLQELAKGATKKRKITRHVLRDGKPQPKEVRGAAGCPAVSLLPACAPGPRPSLQPGLCAHRVLERECVGHPLPPVQASALGSQVAPMGMGLG